MKKVIVFALITLCVSSAVMAQDEADFKFSVGPELSFATGSFSNTHSIGFGGSVQAEVHLQPKLYGTATAGISIYNGKSIAGTTTKQTGLAILPVRVGVKYFLLGGLYGGAQLGVAFLSNNALYKGTAFAYSPLMLGYEFKTKSDKSIDATIKYDAYSGSHGTIGTFGFRLAYIL